MSRALPFVRALGWVRLVLAVPWLLAPIGCSRPPEAAPRVHLRPELKAVNVEKRTLTRQAGQPGFIEAYEQTAIYPKVSGYVEKWNVDIGDTVTEGMVLAHLDVPDLVAEYEEKSAEVALAEARVAVAEEAVSVAEKNWLAAKSQVSEARANLGKYKADVEYRTADYQRIHKLYLDKAVEQPVEQASFKHMQSTIASQRAAEVGVTVAEMTAAARAADFAKAKSDVTAARAKTKVARATENRLAALVGYTNIKAPYDGVVVVRNVNKGDFAQPGQGDLSAAREVRTAPAGARPLFVVARTDKVRIFLDVPEMEANGVQSGSRAHVSIPALDNMEFPAKVTRSSWALSAKTRSLRVEIDIPNPDRRIVPNLYAYGTVELSRTKVWTIPLQATFQLGNRDYCYVFEDGKAVRLPVQLGIDDGTFVEVIKKRIDKGWRDFDGSERVLLGNLSQVSNEEPVNVNPSQAAKK